MPQEPIRAAQLADLPHLVAEILERWKSFSQ